MGVGQLQAHGFLRVQMPEPRVHLGAQASIGQGSLHPLELNRHRGPRPADAGRDLGIFNQAWAVQGRPTLTSAARG
jgi:hypothetical protein